MVVIQYFSHFYLQGLPISAGFFVLHKIYHGGGPMELSEGTILQIITYAVSTIATGSTILWRLNALEKKVEKHNSLIERMVAVEQSCKSAHRRLDGIEGRLRE